MSLNRKASQSKGKILLFISNDLDQIPDVNILNTPNAILTYDRNHLMITRDIFWSCRGLDEQYIDFDSAAMNFALRAELMGVEFYKKEEQRKNFSDDIIWDVSRGFDAVNETSAFLATFLNY